MSRLGIALVVVAVGVGVVGLVAIGGEARLIQTKPLPPPVQGVSVLHRAGQTFIRWLELDLVPRRELTAVELAAARELVEKSSRLRYRVYRSDRPIQRREDATLVGEVLPFSGWDVEHFGKAPPKGVPLPRFIIQEGAGALPLGTGLFVHNPPKPGPAHYLVTVSVNGVENPAVTTENVTSMPVTETVGPGVPVLQRRREAGAVSVHLRRHLALSTCGGNRPAIAMYRASRSITWSGSRRDFENRHRSVSTSIVGVAR